MVRSFEKHLSEQPLSGLGLCRVWHRKPEDPPHSHFGDGRARYTHPRPFDEIVVMYGYAVEGKATRGPSFALQPRQGEALAGIERRRAGMGEVAAFVQRPQASRRWALWWLPNRSYASSLRRTGRTSFPVGALPKYAISRNRVGCSFVTSIDRAAAVRSEGQEAV